MKEVATADLISELINRGAIRVDNNIYSDKRVYVENRYTSDNRKSVPKDVLLLDDVSEF